MLSVSLLTSCQDNDDPQTLVDSEAMASYESGSKYAITPDSALAYLDEYLEASETSSRGLSERKVSSIAPVGCRTAMSRSDGSVIDCENLVYVANFEEMQGYAILAADKRISDKVIAVTDQGSLSSMTFCYALELVDSEKPVCQDYPTTGPGFFTVPECGDEVFMNPNTASLYDETVGDTLVGNFILDDIGAEDEMGTPLSPNSDMSITPEVLSCSLCASYAINEIIEYENNNSHFQNVNTDIVGDAVGVDNSSGCRTEVTSTDWYLKKSTPNLLCDFKYWSQRAPFNNWYPHRRKYGFFGHRKRASAGCFPLAIAKIFTHFEHPTQLTFNGYTVNWNGLMPEVTDSTSAAALLRYISDGCDCWYFYGGTFTFPHNATSFMRSSGLLQAHNHSYNFDRVTSMIDAGKPLIIYGIPSKLEDIFKCHCWNIDGYKIKEKKVTAKTYNGETLVRTQTYLSTINMVHCDFGWGGGSNGYYVSGIFKLNDKNVEHDPGTTSNGNTNYKYYLKVVTY